MYPKQAKTVHAEMLDDELCLYDWQRKEVHALNPTAAMVWQMCDGQTTPQQMASQVKGDLTPVQAEALVWASLEELREAHLLEGEIAKPDWRPVLTRRQVLKVLGSAAAGAILMPVVGSIVAPTPVAAQSPEEVPPTAVDDTASTTTIGGPLSVNVLTNDSLGTPAATLTSFGGGSLGGAVTDNAAGASVPLAGGTLTVDANGQVTLAGATMPGTYTFQYRLSNSAGTSDATVTIQVTDTCPPLPIGDWNLIDDAAVDGDWIRLTSAANDQGGAALYPDAFPFTSDFTISFDYATFGGTGADGFCVFFYDGSGAYPPTLGRYGGALTYANAPDYAMNGLSDAYLGIGFDEYGNFSNPGEAGTTGPGFSPDSVVLRGSGNGTTGYKYLTGVNLFPRTVDGFDRTAPRKVQVNLNSGLVTVRVDFGSGYETIIDQFDLAGDPDQIAAPATLRVGIGASTGGLTNNHDISNFGTC